MLQPEIEETNEKTTELVVVTDTCEVCGSHIDHATDLEVIRHDIAELKATVNGVMELVGMIQSEVGPVMESLQNNPILKTFLGGK